MDRTTDSNGRQPCGASGVRLPNPAPAPHARESLPQNNALQMLASDLQRLNETIAHMVEEGMTVELVRRSRYHNTAGSWGDQMAPVITRKQ